MLAKFFERWPEKAAGKRCCDLSAGCGLVGIVLSKLEAEVTATDLEPNLPLLRKNFEANGESLGGSSLLAMRTAAPRQRAVELCRIEAPEYIAQRLLAEVQALKLTS